MNDIKKNNSPTTISAGQHLKEERETRGWSQQYVAEQIGADRYYLSRWEHGKMLPSPYYREKLCTLFGKNAKELGFLAQEVTQAIDTMGTREAGTPARADSVIHDPSIPPLPDSSYTLVGRQEQLYTLRTRLCADTPSTVIALNGLPGVGKTALALALAHDKEILAHFCGGVLWAGAGKQPDVLGIFNRWGTLLGISAAEASRLTTYEAWAQTIRASIGTRKMLLVVDDIWTLEDFVAFKVGGNDCAYLLTTRFPQLAWHAAANGTFPVTELTAPDSLLLLERLAPLVVQQEPGMAAELVRLVGGLPLALLLAGNYLRVQTYNGQTRRIRQSIERLRTVEMRLHLQEPQAFAERSPSLAHAPAISLHTLIAVSDQQLDQDAREALYALSVFPAKPNTFSEEAALAVCQGSGAELDTLSDMGLLESYAPDRYALHQVIADYASLHRVDAALVERFTRFIADYVQHHEKDYQHLEQESANILAALRLASKYNYLETLVTAGNMFAAFLSLRGSYTEAKDLLERVCQAASTLQNQQGLVTALYRLGSIASYQGEYTQAHEYLQRGLSLTSELHNSPLRSQLLCVLGGIESYQGNYAQAELHLQEALALARQLQDDELVCFVLRSIGAATSDQGKFAEAEMYLNEGLALARRLQKPEHICTLLLNLDQIVLTRGDYTRAEALIKEALEIARQIGYRSAICVLLGHLGTSALEQEKYAEAKESYEQVITLARTMYHREYLIGALANLGLVYEKLGDYQQATAYLEEATALARTLGNVWTLASVLDEWGELCLRQEKIAEAAAVFAEVYHLSKQVSQEHEAMALFGQARVARAQGNVQEARQLGQASLSHFKSMEHRRVAEVEQWLTTLAE